MAAKKVGSTHRTPKSRRAAIVFQFDDGPSSLSLVEFEFQRLCTAARMFMSENPEFHMMGLDKLREAAVFLAESTMRLYGYKSSAQKERDSKADFIKEAIDREILNGTPSRKVAAKVAAEFHLTPKQVRNIRNKGK